MPEFFLELFSEEIPARMQHDGCKELSKICSYVLRDLNPRDIRSMLFGPRRIAFAATLDAETGEVSSELRGPKLGAPEAAILGFARKNSARVEELAVENGYFILRRILPARAAADVILKDLPEAVIKLSWPKSMRWGQGGNFTWIRPLRRIVCLLDAEIVPVKIGPVVAAGETEGHRFMSPESFAVTSCDQWMNSLYDRKVIADAVGRVMKVDSGLKIAAQELGLSIVADSQLLHEVSEIVEWPVALIGKIDEDFMDLPYEVRELSMKVNQRYFALRDADGSPAPYFAFIANIEATDGGKAIVAGNERVLRARFSDARHFWDLDLKTPLDALLPKLDKITFHARIGTQGQRAKRIASLARTIAHKLFRDEVVEIQSEWAGRLCKADLVTGMVCEFPELQGTMGGYYAEKNPRGWDGAIVGPAIKTHYQPKGPSDPVPTGAVGVSVALADKLDTLVQFFNIGETPTGSGDPFALRRAALGVIRIILENNLNLQLDDFVGNKELFNFILERLKVKLRNEGRRFDVLDAVLKAGASDNLVIIMQRVEAVSDFLATASGINLLTAYRRAANILKIENEKDGPHLPLPNRGDFIDQRERDLYLAMESSARDAVEDFYSRNFEQAMSRFAELRPPVDRFFEEVTVNHFDPKIRRNRLSLLAQLRDTMHQIADFSKIEG